MTVPMTTRRPFGVSLLSILLMVGGMLDVIAGILLLFNTGDDEVLRVTEVSSGDLTAYAIASIVIGVVVIFVGAALRNRSNFARYLVGFIALVRLFSVIWLIASYHPIHWYNAVWPLGIYALVVYYLFFDDDARAYYEGV